MLGTPNLITVGERASLHPATKSASFGVDGEIVLVPPGNYDLKFLHWKTALMFGKAPKLILEFAVCTMGDAFEKVLCRYYNVARLVGKPQMFGGFKVGRHSDMLREYAGMFRLPTRMDRVPMAVFESHLFGGTVVTVKNGRNQVKIPEQLQYSKISVLWKIQ